MKQIMKMDFLGMRYTIKYAEKGANPFRLYRTVPVYSVQKGYWTNSTKLVVSYADLNSCLWHLTTIMDNVGRIA